MATATIAVDAHAHKAIDGTTTNIPSATLTGVPLAAHLLYNNGSASVTVNQNGSGVSFAAGVVSWCDGTFDLTGDGLEDVWHLAQVSSQVDSRTKLPWLTDDEMGQEITGVHVSPNALDEAFHHGTRHSGPPQHALRLGAISAASGDAYQMWTISTAAIALAAGDYLEYDIYCDPDSGWFVGAIDIETTLPGFLRSSQPLDQNSIAACPGEPGYTTVNLLAYAHGHNYKRKIPLDALAGQTTNRFLFHVRFSATGAGQNAVSYISNVRIKNASGLKATIYTTSTAVSPPTVWLQSNSSTVDAVGVVVNWHDDIQHKAGHKMKSASGHMVHQPYTGGDHQIHDFSGNIQHHHGVHNSPGDHRHAGKHVHSATSPASTTHGGHEFGDNSGHSYVKPKAGGGHQVQDSSGNVKHHHEPGGAHHHAGKHTHNATSISSGGVPTGGHTHDSHSDGSYVITPASPGHHRIMSGSNTMHHHDTSGDHIHVGKHVHNATTGTGTPTGGHTHTSGTSVGGTTGCYALIPASGKHVLHMKSDGVTVNHELREDGSLWSLGTNHFDAVPMIGSRYQVPTDFSNVHWSTLSHSVNTAYQIDAKFRLTSSANGNAFEIAVAGDGTGTQTSASANFVGARITSDGTHLNATVYTFNSAAGGSFLQWTTGMTPPTIIADTNTHTMQLVVDPSNGFLTFHFDGNLVTFQADPTASATKPLALTNHKVGVRAQTSTAELSNWHVKGTLQKQHIKKKILDEGYNVGTRHSGPPQHSMRMGVNATASGDAYQMWTISTAALTLAAGDYLEYDVYCDPSSGWFMGAVDIETTLPGQLRTSQPLDQNGIVACPGEPGFTTVNLSDYAHGHTYKRNIPLDLLAGQTTNRFLFHVRFAATGVNQQSLSYISNVRIKNSIGLRLDVYTTKPGVNPPTVWLQANSTTIDAPGVVVNWHDDIQHKAGHKTKNVGGNLVHQPWAAGHHQIHKNDGTATPLHHHDAGAGHHHHTGKHTHNATSISSGGTPTGGHTHDTHSDGSYIITPASPGHHRIMNGANAVHHHDTSGDHRHTGDHYHNSTATTGTPTGGHRHTTGSHATYGTGYQVTPAAGHAYVTNASGTILHVHSSDGSQLQFNTSGQTVHYRDAAGTHYVTGAHKHNATAGTAGAIPTAGHTHDSHSDGSYKITPASPGHHRIMSGSNAVHHHDTNGDHRHTGDHYHNATAGTGTPTGGHKHTTISHPTYGTGYGVQPSSGHSYVIDPSSGNTSHIFHTGGAFIMQTPSTQNTSHYLDGGGLAYHIGTLKHNAATAANGNAPTGGHTHGEATASDGTTNCYALTPKTSKHILHLNSAGTINQEIRDNSTIAGRAHCHFDGVPYQGQRMIVPADSTVHCVPSYSDWGITGATPYIVDVKFRLPDITGGGYGVILSSNTAGSFATSTGDYVLVQIDPITPNSGHFNVAIYTYNHGVAGSPWQWNSTSYDAGVADNATYHTLQLAVDPTTTNGFSTAGNLTVHLDNKFVLSSADPTASATKVLDKANHSTQRMGVLATTKPMEIAYFHVKALKRKQHVAANELTMGQVASPTLSVIGTIVGGQTYGASFVTSGAPTPSATQTVSLASLPGLGTAGVGHANILCVIQDSATSTDTRFSNLDSPIYWQVLPPQPGSTATPAAINQTDPLKNSASGTGVQKAFIEIEQVYRDVGGAMKVDYKWKGNASGAAYYAQVWFGYMTGIKDS